MQRPFANPFCLAEPLLREFRGHVLAGGVDLHGALADLDLPAVIAEHIFHEADDKCYMDPLLRHGMNLCLRDKAPGADLRIRCHETAQLPGLALARMLCGVLPTGPNIGALEFS